MATVFFDAYVLVMTVVGILKKHGQSKIGFLLMEQGIIYFVVTLLFNVLLIIFCVLKLNDVMTVMFAVPAQTVSVLAATRLYSQLYVETGQIIKACNRSSSPWQDAPPSNSARLPRQSTSFFTSSYLDFGGRKSDDGPGDTTLTDAVSVQMVETMSGAGQREDKIQATSYHDRYHSDSITYHHSTDLEKSTLFLNDQGSPGKTSDGVTEQYSEIGLDYIRESKSSQMYHPHSSHTKHHSSTANEGHQKPSSEEPVTQSYGIAR
ncbi:hypothetical protein CBS101457_002641 [Exobasidium rhododendri]|nr:hypothetical protein CBS101457_002641 [Exobasidium rhododendri]